MKLSAGARISGRLKVDVLEGGRVVREGRWQPNLVLDQGLNNLATVVLCDLFKYAVKGIDLDIMKESIAHSNTYSLNTGTGQITRITGARSFSAVDIGKLAVSDDGKEAIITLADIGTPTIADVRGVGLNALQSYTTKFLDLYSVQRVGLTTEDGRTNSYSAIAGENGTTTTNNKRTFKRTFLFDEEAANISTPGVTADWSATTVTRVSGTRDFTADDEGTYIEFTGTGDFAKIVTFTSATVVQVDRPPAAPIVGGAYRFHGFRTYTHIGFSHLAAPGDNLNIMVVLVNASDVPTPVKALGANPETGGQQVKVTYEMTVAFEPNTVIGPVSATISDPGNVMSAGAKNGSYTIEAIASSFVAGDGSTDVGSIGLEPSEGGYVALSTVGAALVPVGTGSAPARGAGAASAQMTALGYSPDDFSRVVQGSFGINDAINTSPGWKSMGIFDQESATMLFTFLFNNPQKKPGTHQLTLRFRKSWDRDLS